MSGNYPGASTFYSRRCRRRGVAIPATAAVTGSSSDDDSASTVSPTQMARRVKQFDKQVSFGKTTRGYFNYVSIVPITERRDSEPQQYPVTPRFSDQMSKRECTATIQRWRRDLHRWDYSIKCWTEPLPGEPFVHQPYGSCWSTRRLDEPTDDDIHR
jgi:hypothetical protein